MPDYKGFAVLGDALVGGSKRRADATYGEQLGKSVRGYSELDKARIVRAQANARDLLPAAIAKDPVLGGRADLASAILGMSTAQPNLGTYTEGLGDLGDMEIDRQIADAIKSGDQATARTLSAVKTDKVLPDLGAGGKVVFDPITGETNLTTLGDADIATDTALVAQRQASSAAAMARAEKLSLPAVAKPSPVAVRAGTLEDDIASIEGQLGRKLTAGERADWLQRGRITLDDEDTLGGPADVAPSTAIPVPVPTSRGPAFANVQSRATAAPNVDPPIAGARLAPDGFWYVQKDGRWFRVE